MSSARGRGNRDDDMTEYERHKWEQVAQNNVMMESLRLHKLSTELQASQPKKRTKRTRNPSDAAISTHNLRPRTQRNIVETANEQNNEQIIDDPDYEVVGEFLCDNEDLHNGTPKRKGRKITTMNDIFSRKADMPKIKITANEHGQPIGENYRKFASAIGCQVRKSLPVRFIDWRAVPVGMKDQVWTDLQAYFDMDEAIRKWFIDTSAKKWKDYKTHLKEKYFDETLTDEQMKESLKNILNVDDINGLINYWRSPECQVRSERGKSNRSKLRVNHTSGSISFACRSHNLGKALGRPPRRDEIFIHTHTKKNGVPVWEASGTIDELKAIVEAQPELKDRTIQEGDAYAAVCGAKEPRGRVRVLGLGPKPQEIGTPGLKGLMSTRIQMEILAREKAETKNRTLEQRIRELEEERIAQGGTNVEDLSQHGSNSRQYASLTPERPIDEVHNAPRCEEYDNYDEGEDNDQYGLEDENLLPHTHVEMEETLPPSRPAIARSAVNMTTATSATGRSAMNNTTTAARSANDTHAGTDKSLLPPRHDAADSPIDKTTTATNGGPRLHDDLVGKDVILYAILRSELPVARGTVLSTNPNTIVGGQPLGNEYCEVVVNIVMKRDAMLPRTYGDVQTMASADRMHIAWPFNRLKECRKKASGKKESRKKECKNASNTHLKGTAGTVGQSLA